MFSYLKYKNNFSFSFTKIVSKSNSIFNNEIFFEKKNRFYMFNKYSHVRERKKEKYSKDEITQIINKLLDEDYRNFNLMPEEFHKYSDILITLEKPVEPEEYECCGKGCNPCTWDRYDKKVRNVEDLINKIFEEVNNLENNT
jgi:hypothetical protein